MQEITNKLIVALDVNTLEDAKRFVDILYPKVKMFKVGSQLFTAYGPAAVRAVGERGAKVFLDLKFYDIPQTVCSAVSSGTGLSCSLVVISSGLPNIAGGTKGDSDFPVFMMTVHTEGDTAMLRDAMRGAIEKAKELNIKKRPLIVGVTVLTSERGSSDTKEVVLEKARKAKDSGLDGVVCSANEAAEVREECGDDFIIVTPGIRPKGYPADDQKRTATAEEAISAGADFIVVGRPILEAKDPLKAVKDLM